MTFLQWRTKAQLESENADRWGPQYQTWLKNAIAYESARRDSERSLL